MAGKYISPNPAPVHKPIVKISVTMFSANTETKSPTPARIDPAIVIARHPNLFVNPDATGPIANVIPVMMEGIQAVNPFPEAKYWSSSK